MSNDKLITLTLHSPNAHKVYVQYCSKCIGKVVVKYVCTHVCMFIQACTYFCFHIYKYGHTSLQICAQRAGYRTQSQLSFFKLYISSFIYLSLYLIIHFYLLILFFVLLFIFYLFI